MVMPFITYQANIDFLPGASAPDEYDPSVCLVPSDDFVVTRDKDGKCLSYYGELSWNRTPYDPEGRTCYLNFAFWGKEPPTLEQVQLSKEMRLLMFQLIYLRPGPSLTNGSLSNYQICLWKMAYFCTERSICISDLLANAELLLECTNDLKGNLVQLSALVNFLRKLGKEVTGFEVTGRKVASQLQMKVQQWISGKRQHPPIPTRIYSEVLSRLAQELHCFEQIVSGLVGVLQKCVEDPLCGRDLKRQRLAQLKHGLPDDTSWRSTFNELLSKYGLERFWEDRGYDRSIRGLSNAFTDAFMLACLQIQAYTGMRLNEARALPWNCLEEVKRDEDGRIHYIVNGRVTKLSNGKIKRVQWVTSESGREAILLAQRLSFAIYKARGDTPSKRVDRINSYFLFIAANYALPLGNEQKNVPPLMNLSSYAIIRERLQPAITEEDLYELENIDPHRAWRTEARFQIGQPWTLTSHQLRRSLALYAQRSGLVSLASLKRQLQHITQEMSAYYARGSAFAKNFIGDGHPEKHFGEEWQEAQPVSQYLSYAANVLFADENELFGVHPHWVKHRLRNEDGTVIIDRATTMKRFKKGELAYRDTILGGCVKVGECDKNPLDILHVECLTDHCRNMVGNKKKLERAVTIQGNLVRTLEKYHPHSSELRHERSNLDVLNRTLDSVSGGTKESRSKV